MDQKGFDQQVAESVNNAAQTSALDLLQKVVELADDLDELIERSHLQPVLIIGVLEIAKSRLMLRTWEDVKGVGRRP